MLPCSQSRPCIFYSIFFSAFLFLTILSYNIILVHQKNFCFVIFYLCYPFTPFRYTIYEIAAVTASVIQNACHTPTAPIKRLTINAAGMITTTYLHNEMISECTPFPRPSSAPLQITDTDEAMKPRLMTLSATLPACIVTGFAVNSPISCPGTARQITVPTVIITSTRIRPSRKLLCTRLCSHAP